MRNKKNNIKTVWMTAVITLCFVLAGCSKQIEEPEVKQDHAKKEENSTVDAPENKEVERENQEKETEEKQEEGQQKDASDEKKEEKEEEPEQVEQEEKKLVVVDPGHSGVVTSGKEPIGPGAKDKKAAGVTGTSGAASGLKEYELTLMVSLKIKDILEERGYEVLMIREDHKANISNVERAKIANEAEADAFIRIHADGSENASAKGAMTICQTPANPYNSQIYKECKALSEAVIKNMVSTTGAKDRGVWETDTMTGINWSEVPVTIVEMGFMTNKEEDLLLASQDYQNKMAEGICNGIDEFFN